MLGALVQIDPVWVYGPYNPIAIVPGAQPDWYLGWVEGAMRLFPGVNVRLGAYLIPNVFFPGMLLPALVFVGLYAYPFVEKLIYVDTSDQPHNVLRLPYQQPFNTAFGCAGFMFLLVLFFAGGDDVIAMATSTSVADIRSILRVLSLALPAITFILVWLLCSRVRRRRSAWCHTRAYLRCREHCRKYPA